MRLNSARQSPPQKLDPGLLNQRTFDARNQFSELFELLLNVRSLGDQSNKQSTSILNNRISSELQVLVESRSELLYALPRAEQYSRHVIGIQDSWIGFICRWETQVESAIHGHPSFAYYQVLEGDFLMDLYKSVDVNSVKHERTLRMTRGENIWKQAPKLCYDNLIHKVSTQDSPGFTLHLFSENPCLGKHFKTT